VCNFLALYFAAPSPACPSKTPKKSSSGLFLKLPTSESASSILSLNPIVSAYPARNLAVVPRIFSSVKGWPGIISPEAGGGAATVGFGICCGMLRMTRDGCELPFWKALRFIGGSLFVSLVSEDCTLIVMSIIILFLNLFG